MSTKKILIINGHPDQESFNYGLSEAYIKGAKESNAIIKEINIRELEFNPNLQFGYQKRTALEPDLIDAQEKLKWADHIVWVYPIWWGSVPAIMKGFLDRVLLPGYHLTKEKAPSGGINTSQAKHHTSSVQWTSPPGITSGSTAIRPIMP